MRLGISEGRGGVGRSALGLYEYAEQLIGSASEEYSDILGCNKSTAWNQQGRCQSCMSLIGIAFLLSFHDWSEMCHRICNPKSRPDARQEVGVEGHTQSAR